VIVGKTEKPSPTLTAEITSVNLNPTWTVRHRSRKPRSRRICEKIPAISPHAHGCARCARRSIDPRSVDWSGAHTRISRCASNRHMECAGCCKIDMPNPFSVYMHDTNQRNLFSDDYRFDSHGCSRVDNVRDSPMAAQGPPALEPRRHRRRHRHRTARRHPPAPESPVAWVYLTGWMTKDQTVQSATTSTTRTRSFWKPPPRKRHSSIRRPIIH